MLKQGVVRLYPVRATIKKTWGIDYLIIIFTIDVAYLYTMFSSCVMRVNTPRPKLTTLQIELLFL